MIFISYLLLLLSVAGIVICLFIFRYLLGHNAEFKNKWCRADGRFDCDTVLSHGKIFKGIDLADLGFIYFVGQFLFLAITAIHRLTTEAFFFLRIAAALSFLLSLFLIGYQGLKIKRWCKFCLLITADTWLQDALIWKGQSSLLPVTFPPHFGPMLVDLGLCVSIASIWLLIKPQVIDAINYRETIPRYLKWKNDPHLFSVLLQREETAFQLPAEQAVYIGNRDVPNHLMLALTPYCKLCAAAFSEICEIQESRPFGISFSVYFPAEPANREGKKTVAIHKILSAWIASGKTRTSEILKDWYIQQDLLSWSSKWATTPQSDEEAEKMLSYHQTWYKQNGIGVTPLVFVKGYKLPDIYNLRDFQRFLRALSSIEPAVQKKTPLLNQT